MFCFFQFEANFHNWDVFSTDNYNIIMCDDILLQKCKGRITNWFNRIMQANGDNNTTDEPNPPPISLFVDTSINRPSNSNLMVESDQEDEEDSYSNIGIPPTTMAPTAPIVNKPLTVSTQSLRRNSSVVMLSDDEQNTDQEQETNQYMQTVSPQMSTSINSTDTSADKTSAPISSTQVDTITQIPSSTNELQLPQKVSKQKINSF